jgi:hypothetical protein
MELHRWAATGYITEINGAAYISLRPLTEVSYPSNLTKAEFDVLASEGVDRIVVDSSELDSRTTLNVFRVGRIRRP